MYGKCRDKHVNKIFQNKTTIEFKFDVHQNCKAQKALIIH